MRKDLKKKLEEKKKRGEKETPQTCKSPTQRKRFITTTKIVTEYTHIHIHPWAKSKQSDKSKVQYIDLVNKGNKKLYLTVKNKTN